MNTQHTPGPWFVGCTCQTHIQIVTCNESDEPNALIATIDETSHNPLAITDEVKANARLISASPELLEACEAMLRAFENYSNEFNPSGRVKRVCDWGKLNDDMMLARAAIAKATGNT